MIRNKLIEALNKKYTAELDKSISLIMPKLTEAFINIYGENHRNAIVSTTSSLKYSYFLSERLFKLLLETKSESTLNKLIAMLYLIHIKFLDREYNKISDNEELKFILNNYVTTFPYSKDIFQYYIQNIATECANYGVLVIPEREDDYSIYKTIFLPLFTTDIKTIFHEVNHVLVENLIGVCGPKLCSPTLLPDEESDELTNDYIAELALQEYLRLGGIIPNPLRKTNLENKYETDSYIVKYLFDKLGPLILECSISKRYNLLYKPAGYSNIVKLSSLINDLFLNDYDEDKYIELISLVDEITELVTKAEPVDYDKIFKELEARGYRVRRLKKEDTPCL